MPYKNPEDRRRRARGRRENPERWREINRESRRRNQKPLTEDEKEKMRVRSRQCRLARYEQYLVRRLRKKEAVLCYMKEQTHGISG